jgi:hypothetical protein
MTRGELDLAIRRSFNNFDKWNDVSGFVEKGCGYYYELMGLIEDAVHCGAQAACGDFRTLEDIDEFDTLTERIPDAHFVEQHVAMKEKKNPTSQ